MAGNSLIRIPHLSHQSRPAEMVISMETTDDGFVIVEHNVAKSGPYAKPQYLADISEYIDSISEDIWPVNKKIHDNPELGFAEFIAHETLTKFFKSRPGWKVTPSAYGMETAWVAEYDSGKRGPVVSFNVEMDALDGMGHACGHNLIATASVAGALATAAILDKFEVAGKIVVFGTPAEEGGGGKIKLLDAGAYRDYKVDLNLISHPGLGVNTALARTSAYNAFTVEYFGREAHAAAAPWLGINALDALVTAYNALSVLRQQTMPGDIIQGNITSGGLRPNVIHAYAAGDWVVRAKTQARLVELKKKVMACFEAGAAATGARLRVTPTQACADHVPNRVLGGSFRRYFNELSPPSMIPWDDDIDEIQGSTNASSDQGNISYAMPSISPNFSIPPGPQGANPHNPDFAIAAGTKAAYECALRVGKGLAGAAVDVLTIEGMLVEVKKEWEEDIKAASL